MGISVEGASKAADTCRGTSVKSCGDDTSFDCEESDNQDTGSSVGSDCSSDELPLGRSSKGSRLCDNSMDYMDEPDDFSDENDCDRGFRDFDGNDSDDEDNLSVDIEVDNDLMEEGDDLWDILDDNSSSDHTPQITIGIEWGSSSLEGMSASSGEDHQDDEEDDGQINFSIDQDNIDDDDDNEDEDEDDDAAVDWRVFDDDEDEEYNDARNNVYVDSSSSESDDFVSRESSRSDLSNGYDGPARRGNLVQPMTNNPPIPPQQQLPVQAANQRQSVQPASQQIPVQAANQQPTAPPDNQLPTVQAANHPPPIQAANQQPPAQIPDQQPPAKAEATPTPSSSLDPSDIDSRGDGMCCICLDSLSNHVVVPCGHICLCQACKEQFTSNDKHRRKPKCPLCKTPFSVIIKVYK